MTVVARGVSCVLSVCAVRHAPCVQCVSYTRQVYAYSLRLFIWSDMGYEDNIILK